MVVDFEGQIKEALNMTGQGQREGWYNKWGKHYLLSLSGAYSNELCNNSNLQAVFQYVKNNTSTLHIIGLVSDGGVHSHLDHFK